MTVTLELAVVHQLAAVGSAIMEPLRNSPRIELSLVMVILPTICNAMQYWVVDVILRGELNKSLSRSWRERVRGLAGSSGLGGKLGEGIIASGSFASGIASKFGAAISRGRRSGKYSSDDLEYGAGGVGAVGSRGGERYDGGGEARVFIIYFMIDYD